MNAIATGLPHESAALRALAHRCLEPFRYAEDLALSLALGGLVVIPLAEIAGRRFFHLGISGAPYLVQHLTLVIAMLGGAVAARENRLLALSNLGAALKGKLGSVLHISCGVVATAISASFSIAGIQFVAAEKGAAKILAYGIPVWVVQALLPAGFALVTWRLVRHSASDFLGRTVAALLAGAIVLIAAFPPAAPAHFVVPALATLAIATMIGVPIFVTLGGVALILFWGHGVPIASLPIDQYSLVTNPSIPAIPLFTVAGYFLAKAARRND